MVCKALITVIVILAAILQAHPQGGGSPNTKVRALAIDPSNPSILYAGTDGSGIFRSTNGGASWTAASSDLGINQFVRALAIDPSNPSRLYAASHPGVFRSTDGGALWTSVRTTRSQSSALAIDRINPATVYAGTSGDGGFGSGIVFKSTNGGTNWTSASVNGLQYINALVVDPSNPAILYAGGSGTNFDLFKSTDAGESWHVTPNFPGTSVSSLVIDPQNPSLLYAVGAGGVFLSTNGGVGWSPRNSGLPSINVSSLAIDPSNLLILYAGTDGGGVFKSTNLGTSWVPTGTFPCTPTISPNSQSFPATGGPSGAGSVSVTAPNGCAWTATSNGNFITVTSGAIGSGNGTVWFSVAANPGTASRTGTLSIAGQTFTVTQAGSLPPPAVSEGGVVNSASYALTVAPGAIAAVFGSRLTDGTSCLPPSCNPAFGSNGRLNITMAGAQVSVNGTPVPIFYAIPGQLGVQIPAELTGSSATIQVLVGGQTSATLTIAVEPVSPGIFTFTADGRGAGAFTHVDGSAVSPQNPAHPGELVILYATGLGQVSPAVPTGALPGGASRTVAATTVSIDGISVIPDFAGLAGCCVGLNQINVRLPENTRTANDIPVLLSVGGKQSNTVTIAVQPRAGTQTE